MEQEPSKLAQGAQGAHGAQGALDTEFKGLDTAAQERLRQMIFQMATQLDRPGEAEAAAAPRDFTVDMEMIARLAVAHNPDGNKEIRLKLKDSVLPGTEIIFSRDASGLTIRFSTNSQQAQQLLEQNLEKIQKALQGRLSRESVSVKVDFKKASEDDNDPDYFVKRR